VNNPNYVGSASSSFVINKAAATVTLSNLTQTYTGSALTPTATTVPANLAITWTGAPDTNAGTYPVTATVTDANYTGSASGSFVIGKATATVTLGNLTPTYTGTPQSPTVTTVPANLTTSLTGAPDTNAGTYSVSATITDPNYTGSATASFVISPAAAVFSNLSASQSITFGTASITLSGTISAGAVYPPNTEAVSITINGAAVMPSVGSSGSFSTNFLTSSIPASTTPYTIAYTYGGDTNFASASDSTTTLTVNAPAATLQSITVTPTNSSLTFGGTQQFTATGNYSDSSTQDLTATATWSSSVSAVATVSTSGLATAAQVGATIVTATSGNVSGSTTLVVNGSGNFVPTGSMTVARDPFTATRLNDGRVLIAGGCGSPFCGTTLASAELSDPAGQTFSPIAAAMSVPRSYHTATLLNNGKVLIVGGYSDNSANAIASAEIYDPASQTFSPTVGSLNAARGQHTATLLDDGTVLIAGGSSKLNAVNSTELYDPNSGTFSLLGNMNTARYAHTATLLGDGTVLLAGGEIGPGENPTATAELYIPATKTFASLTGMTTPRAYQTATLLNDGTVLLAGGILAEPNFVVPMTNTAEVYNPAGRSFRGVGSMSTARASHTATLLNDGTVLVAGGAGQVDGTGNQDSTGTSPTAAAELYIPSNGGFSPTGSLNTARSLQTATLLTNGSVLIAGGAIDSTGTLTNSAELYLPAIATPVSLVVTPASTTVSPGTTQQFIATGTFSDSSTHQLASAIWSTSDSTLAQVTNDASNSGLALAVSTGTATITARTGIVSGSATLTVATLSSIVVAPASPSVFVGVAQQFTATGNYADGTSKDLTATVTWSSSVPAVATIGTAPFGTPGLASTASAGSTTITATFGAVSGSTTLTVSAPTVVSIAVAPPSFYLGPLNNSLQYTATGTYNDGSVKDVTGLVAWSSLNANASISASGVATAASLGQTTIQAAYSGVVGSATLTVVDSGYLPTSAPGASGSTTLLTNGKVLFAGTPVGGAFGTFAAQLYDPATKSFGATGAPNNYLGLPTLLNNGQVLFATGALSAGTGVTSMPAELYDPGAGTFTTLAANLNDTRYATTATMLNNGEVLYVGGFNTAVVGTAELYNPETQTFSYTGSLNTARDGHTATLLNSGKVLIVGGFQNGANLASAELYDPTSGTFAPTGGLNTARSSHTATLLNNGMVLIAGGQGASGALASAELYDPVAGTFTLTGNLNVARAYPHVATLINSGEVLIVGGFDSSFNPLATTELYDPVAGTFAFTGSLNPTLSYPTATMLTSGNVLVAGTNSGGTLSAEIYLPAAATPLNLASIAVTPASPVALVGGAQQFIATGTFSDNSTQQLASAIWSATDLTGSNVAQITNDATNRGIAFAASRGTSTITACAGAICGSTTLTVDVLTYTQLTPSTPPTPRCCMGMAFDPVSNATLMFGGVIGYYSPVGDTWQLNGGQWSQLSPGNAPSPREGPAMAFDAATNTVVLFGGSSGLFGGACCDLNDTWIWSGATSTWTQINTPGPPARRFDGDGMAYDPSTGTIVLFGGVVQGNTYLGDTWTWNGVTQTWTQQSPAASPSPRGGHGMATDAAGNVVLFGGTNGTANSSDTWVWNGTTWQQQSPASSPPARSGHAMAYDPGLNEVVLFGGYNFNDTWIWDGATWSQVTPPNAPHDRYSFGMNYDGAAHAVVLFGGFSVAGGGPILSDTWELAPAP
jgi:hypothetical protein